MDELQIKTALQDLSVTLEGKSKTETKTAIDAFEVQIKESFNAQLDTKQTEFNTQLETVKAGLIADIKEVQDYADALDVKLQTKGTKPGEQVDALKMLITENFDMIKTVRKGHAVDLSLKDMTLATSLTGDQPRVYDSNVAAFPRDMANFSDVIRTFPIDGGTFTFPKELAQTGKVLKQVEGANKAELVYKFEMIDVNTDFIAGFCVYSKKMANNLPFLENFLPQALRRDYYKAENLQFYTEAFAGVTQSTLVGSKNEVESIIDNAADLMGHGYMANAVLVNPTQYASILLTAGTATGGGAYSLPGVVSIVNGVVTINGIRVIPASWVVLNKYLIGDFSEMAKIVTQGLGVNFFEQDSDNVRKNNITARVESQTALAILRPDAFRAGDFTAA